MGLLHWKHKGREQYQHIMQVTGGVCGLCRFNIIDICFSYAVFCLCFDFGCSESKLAAQHVDSEECVWERQRQCERVGCAPQGSVYEGEMVRVNSSDKWHGLSLSWMDSRVHSRLNMVNLRDKCVRKLEPVGTERTVWKCVEMISFKLSASW